MLQSLQEGGASAETAGFAGRESVSPTGGSASGGGGESGGAWDALSTFCPPRARFNLGSVD